MYEVPFQVIDILESLVGEIGRSKIVKGDGHWLMSRQDRLVYFYAVFTWTVQFQLDPIRIPI